jgi:seryl-tRNA synthetase
MPELLARRGYRLDINKVRELDWSVRGFKEDAERRRREGKQLSDQRRIFQKRVEDLTQRTQHKDFTVTKEASNELNQLISESDRLNVERLRLLSMLPRVEEALSAAERDLKSFLAEIPNTPAEDTPDGADETANVEIHRWGTPSLPAWDGNRKLVRGFPAAVSWCLKASSPACTVRSASSCWTNR